MYVRKTRIRCASACTSERYGLKRRDTNWSELYLLRNVRKYKYKTFTYRQYCMASLNDFGSEDP
jgi:hypothetical protein